MIPIREGNGSAHKTGRRYVTFAYISHKDDLKLSLG